MTDSSLSELAAFAAKLRGLIADCTTPPPTTVPFHLLDFNRLALELFALQYAKNEPYRRLCESRKVGPRDVAHWRDIPAAPTVAFKEFEMTCLPPDKRTAVFFSSGTTTQLRSRHFHHADSLAVYENSLLPWFKAHLKPSRSRLIFLTPPPHQAPNSSLVHMFASLQQELGANSIFTGWSDAAGLWQVDVEKTLDALTQAMAAKNPVLLLGTAFTLVHLLDHLEQIGARLALPAGSGVMETGGYKGRSRTLSSEELHREITHRLGVPLANIVCEYGMSELSSQAYDRMINRPVERKRKFQFPPWTRVQIISPESGNEVAEGETGLIRVFDLANVYSVLALQTEDLGVRNGDGFELLGRAAAAEPRGCSLQAIG